MLKSVQIFLMDFVPWLHLNVWNVDIMGLQRKNVLTEHAAGMKQLQCPVLGGASNSRVS